jgi:hypothetical protein
MCTRIAIALTVCVLSSVQAQPDFVEPPDYPNSMPGPNTTHGGELCFHLASGSLSPGDVDWLQVTLSFPSARTVVDVDITSTGGRSALMASVVGGSSQFNMSDSNNAADSLCGSGGNSVPLGNAHDSAVDFGATQAGAIINLAVTGQGDFGFTGSHSHTFTYDVWVYALREDTGCESDLDCDDGTDCTVDICDMMDGTCHNFADHGHCDDGVFCNGVETCDATEGCLEGVSPCESEVPCDESLRACVGCETDADCDDGVFCNGQEQCVKGVCKSGETPACDDGVACTVDFCDEKEDTCVHVPNHNYCRDDNFCNGQETCHPQEGCREGRPRCAINLFGSRPGRGPN